MRIDRDGSVAVLAMTTGKANAMNRAWFASMASALDELARSDARALVLVGPERFFSGGLDLRELQDCSAADMAELMVRFTDTMLRLFAMPRPVVAAINGHAIAGGCVLALQADERIMGDAAGKIGLNEVTLGVGLPTIVTETLRCQVPPRSLVPVALEGRLFSPPEALAAGLVDQVVPQAELLARAVQRAKALGEVPAVAFGQVKRELREGVAAAIRAANERGAASRWAETWTCPEARERIKAAVARLGGR